MKASTDVTDAINTTREILQHVVILIEGLSERVEEMADELARIKDAQNELMAGLALYERVKAFKEDFGLEEVKPPLTEEHNWDAMEAYCSSCTKMVPIVEPVSTSKNGRITVRAKCRTCGTNVFRTLS